MLEDALAAMSAHTEARAQSLAGREALRSALEAARAATRAAQAGEQRLALELGSRRTAFASAGQALARLETQRAEAAARQTRLAAEHAAGDEPEFELAGQLEDRLAARLETEAALAAARDAHAALTEAVRGHERARAQAEAEAGGLRTRLEAARLATQEQRTRRDGLVEALAELSDQAPGALCAQLPADAGEALWLEAFETLFRELPLIFIGKLAEYFALEDDLPHSGVWKVMGDEVVFAAMPHNVTQAQLIAAAFSDAVMRYDQRIETFADSGVKRPRLRHCRIETEAGRVIDYSAHTVHSMVLGPTPDRWSEQAPGEQRYADEVALWYEQLVRVEFAGQTGYGMFEVFVSPGSQVHGIPPTPFPEAILTTHAD